MNRAKNTAKKWQEDEALRRFKLISPLLQEGLDEARKLQIREQIATENGISIRTLYRYEKAWREDEFQGLKPCDREKHRRQDLPDNFEELLQQAIQLKREVPKRSVAQIDTGLLGAMSELDMESVLYGNDIFTKFKGALTEQFVLQQLISDTAYIPYYYAGEKSTYETDFIIQKKQDVIPIEVKAGSSLKSKSLRVYHDKYRPPVSIRISASEYVDQEWMKNIPLWCVNAI